MVIDNSGSIYNTENFKPIASAKIAMATHIPIVIPERDSVYYKITIIDLDYHMHYHHR